MPTSVISSTCAAPCDLLALTSRDAVIVAFPRQCRFRRATHSGQPANHQASLLFLRRETFGAVRTLVAQRLAFGETHSKLRFVAPLSPCIREADDVASMRGRGGVEPKDQEIRFE